MSLFLLFLAFLFGSALVSGIINWLGLRLGMKSGYRFLLSCLGIPAALLSIAFYGLLTVPSPTAEESLMIAQGKMGDPGPSAFGGAMILMAFVFLYGVISVALFMWSESRRSE